MITFSRRMWGFEYLCEHCGMPLFQNELLCLQCYRKVDWRLHSYTFLEQALQFEVPIHQLLIGAFYQKNSPLQSVIKVFKYRGRSDLAFLAGKVLAYSIQNSHNIVFVPVPIHLQKRVLRGYNQAESIAKGIQNITQKEVIHLLKRKKHSSSLTKLNRVLRANSTVTYYPNEKVELPLHCKEIYLVDDVITTGSTIVQCIRAIQQHPSYSGQPISAICFGHSSLI